MQSQNALEFRKNESGSLSRDTFIETIRSFSTHRLFSEVKHNKHNAQWNIQESYHNLIPY